MFSSINPLLKILKANKIFLYPTDTVWGIGCDATNSVAVSKIYDLKKRDDSKALICLVKDVEMLSHYVEIIPDEAYEFFKDSDRPTSIIYPNAKNLAPNLVAEDGSIAIRICKTEFCQELFSVFKKPIVSTSANISGSPTPLGFKDIKDEILKGVDYIVDLPDNNIETKPSRIIKFDGEGTAHIIRD